MFLITQPPAILFYFSANQYTKFKFSALGNLKTSILPSCLLLVVSNVVVYFRNAFFHCTTFPFRNLFYPLYSFPFRPVSKIRLAAMKTSVKQPPESHRSMFDDIKRTLHKHLLNVNY